MCQIWRLKKKFSYKAPTFFSCLNRHFGMGKPTWFRRSFFFQNRDLIRLIPSVKMRTCKCNIFTRRIKVFLNQSFNALTLASNQLDRFSNISIRPRPSLSLVYYNNSLQAVTSYDCNFCAEKFLKFLFRIKSEMKRWPGWNLSLLVLALAPHKIASSLQARIYLR